MTLYLYVLLKVELVLGLERIFSRLRRFFGAEHLQYEEITKQRKHKLIWFLKQDVLSVKNILAQLKREESDSGTLYQIRKFISDCLSILQEATQIP